MSKTQRKLVLNYKREEIAGAIQCTFISGLWWTLLVRSALMEVVIKGQGLQLDASTKPFTDTQSRVDLSFQL